MQFNPFFNIIKPILSNDDYAALPPLVPKGEDREKVLNDIVEKFLTPSNVEYSDTVESIDIIESHCAQNGFFLDQKAFVDGNNSNPIDLGELLQRIESRLEKKDNSDDSQSQPVLFILLRECNVIKCCYHGKIQPFFVAFRTKFGENLDFSGTRFNDNLNCFF